MSTFCVFRATSLTAARYSCMLLLCLHQIYGVCSQCADNQVEVGFNETLTMCCDTCKPGKGVESLCSPSQNTRCHSCTPGKTFSDVTSHEKPCKQCATCGETTHFIIHPCNETHNTLCGCPVGSYYDPEADQCKLCDLCPAGWGAWHRCTMKQSTICTQCKSNVTFSDKMDSYSMCKACTQCSDMEVMLQECSVTEDTICFSVNAGRGPTYNYSTPTIYDQDDDDDGDIIPVYCAALGLVVAGLLGYAVFKHRRRMLAKRRHKAPCTHDDVEYSKASGGDSGVFVENDSPKKYTYNMASKFRDLPHTKRKELEAVFCSTHSDSWKKLAIELGYSQKQIVHFESRRSNNGKNCFKHLLHNWEKRDMSTVHHLVNCLRNIGRDDAAKVLHVVGSTEGKTELILTQHNNIV